MNGIQIILLTGIILISIYFVTRSQNKWADIVFLFFLIIVAIVFVLRPELTNKLAHLVGVGRGADLVVYVSILIFWFVTLKLYARLRRVEKMLTDIVRKDAINNATHGGSLEKS
jgi:small membrane protein